MMKSLRLLAALTLLLVTFGIAGVTNAIAALNTIVVTNTTSYTMTEFYTSPSDASAWDTTNNLLTGLSILPGQTTTINILNGIGNGNGNGRCNYDLMAVLYGAAQFAYQYQVDVCNGATWTITP
jgi:hypothetical protein